MADADEKLIDILLEVTKPYIEDGIKVIIDFLRKHIRKIILFFMSLVFLVFSISFYKIPHPKMIKIQGGSFMMGSSNEEAGRNSNEIHEKVKVDSFEMAETELTRGEFYKFVLDTGYLTDSEKINQNGTGCQVLNQTKKESNKNNGNNTYNWHHPGFHQTDSHPVVCVSLNDAQEYIKWINKNLGENYRLPTEKEWEYAARLNQGTPFYENTCIDAKRANFADTEQYNDCQKTDLYIGKTKEVKSYFKGNFDLYDMAGNAEEWTCSSYDKGNNNTECPTNNANSSMRTVKGGSWIQPAKDLRFAYRTSYPPNSSYTHIGFRLAKDENKDLTFSK